MSYTKNRDWVVGTEGDPPMESKRHKNKAMVVIDGPDGEYFGWEDSDGRLFVGTLVTLNAAAQTTRDNKATEVSDQAAKHTTYQASYAALKAKRDADTALDLDDLNTLADLFFRRDLE